MSDFQAVAQEVISNFEFSNPESPLPSVLTAEDLPADMPLTNHLDAMTSEQARWAIENGDAWLEYLKANDGEVVGFASVIEVEVSDAEKRDAIFSVLGRVEASVIDKQGNVISKHQTKWVETLAWAFSDMPTCFVWIRRFLEQELENIR